MSKSDATRLLGGLTARRFLREHWQKKPLLIRQAFPTADISLTPEELAGLACEEAVESRLVQQHQDQSDWALRYGPFVEADFANLPAERWTLLVQDVEKHLPELAWIPASFDFIANWRIDDLMVSHAAPEGTVGPHVDQYDVFLLQGMGRRRWQIDTDARHYRQRRDTELKLIEDFSASEDWVLEPGDMLYLPPGVAHYGVALEACMTYSIGFRAPSHREMLADFLGLLAEQPDADARYHDPELEPSVDQGRLDPNALHTVKTALRRYLQPGDDKIETWFGCFITESKPGLEDAPPEHYLTDTALRGVIAAGASIRRSDTTRFAWFPTEEDHAQLFVAGEHYASQNQGFATLLCRHRALSSVELQAYLEHDGVVSLLTNLYNAGHIVFENDD